jgi:anaerobic ribonucleoside-triphosphate reductase activating protein
LSFDPKLRIGRVLHGTLAEGPGLRTAVWVQGCSIRCKGCINPHLFSVSGGESVDPEAVVSQALDAGVEGLTLLGGEPFDQAAACASLAWHARDAGLGVICFTGYTRESLERGDDSANLIAAVDLLVDGPYLADHPDEERALVGSTNQRFLHLTPRYANYDPTRARNRVELRIGPDGIIEAAGFLTRDGLETFSASLGSRQTFRRHSHTIS